MTLFHVSDITWDTDRISPKKLGLPRECEIEAEDEESVADALSDKYGWCVFDFAPPEPVTEKRKASKKKNARRKK